MKPSEVWRQCSSPPLMEHQLHKPTRGSLKERCYDEHYSAVAPVTGSSCLLKDTQRPAAGRLWTDWRTMAKVTNYAPIFLKNPPTSRWLHQQAETKGRLQKEKPTSSRPNLAHVRNNDILTLPFFQPKINQLPTRRVNGSFNTSIFVHVIKWSEQSHHQHMITCSWSEKQSNRRLDLREWFFYCSAWGTATWSI